MSKSMKCDFSGQHFDMVGRASGLSKVGCWFVGVADLTGTLHVLYLQLSPPASSSLAPITSRILISWYRLIQVVLENGY